MWKFLELPKRNDGKFIKKAFISKIGEKGFNLDPSTLTWVLINLNFIYSDIVSNIGSSILLIITIEGIKSMKSQIIRLIAWLVGLNSRAIHVSRPTSLIQPTLQLTFRTSRRSNRSQLSYSVSISVLECYTIRHSFKPAIYSYSLPFLC